MSSVLFDARRKVARARPLLAGLALLAMPPEALQQALAATAGTLFEAAPFVLAAALLPSPVLRWFGALGGCGCGDRGLPAALSVPATALCWITFGPAVALARLAAAFALAFRRRHAGGSDPDPAAQLESIALPAFGLALALQVPALVTLVHGSPVAALFLGLAFGALAPCATTAVALAAMLRGVAPCAAYALLASAGFVPPLRGFWTNGRTRRASWSMAGIGVACALLAARGGHGFVNPRLVPMLVAGALAAMALLRLSTRASWPLVPAAAMLSALAMRTAPSALTGDWTDQGAYAGERVRFTGIATQVTGRIALERPFITCCRADAVVLVLPTDVPPRSTRPGAWLDVAGVLVQTPDGLILRSSSRRAVPPPGDPYLYR